MAIEPKDIVLNHDYLLKFLKNVKVISKDTELRTLSQIFILPTFEDGWGTFKKTYRITEIGDSLFENFENLRMVEIPNTVIRIGAKAFKNCKCLIKIKINENLKQIDSEAFANCKGFSDKSKVLNIPSSVKFIGADAFKGVKYINYSGDAVGANWGAEENLATYSNSNSFDVDDNVSTDDKAEEARRKAKIAQQNIEERKKAGETRMVEEKNIILNNEWFNAIFNLIPKQKFQTKQFNIPSTYEANNTIYHIVWIANGLFEDCEVLEKVILPDSIRKIGQNAFKNCFDLEDINFPKSLKIIESNAFDGCFSLSSIYEPFVIPSTVEEIGQDAFKGVQYIQYEGKATGAPWGAKKFSAKAKTEEEQIVKVEEKQSKFDESNIAIFFDKLNSYIDKKANSIANNQIVILAKILANDEKMRLERELSNLKLQFEDKQRIFILKDNIINSLTSDKSRLQEEKIALEESKRKAEEEAKVLDDKVKALQADNNTLFEQNNTLAQEKNTLTEKNNILFNKNNEKKEKITELESQIEQLNTLHSEELAKKEKEIEEALEEAKRQAEEKQQLQEEHNRQLEEKEKALADLATELAEKKEENLKLDSDNKLLYSIRSNLERDLYAKDEVIKNLNAENRAINSKLTDYKIEIKNLENLNRDLKNRVSVKKKVKSKKLSS